MKGFTLFSDKEIKMFSLYRIRKTAKIVFYKNNMLNDLNIWFRCRKYITIYFSDNCDFDKLVKIINEINKKEKILVYFDDTIDKNIYNNFITKIECSYIVKGLKKFIKKGGNE